MKLSHYLLLSVSVLFAILLVSVGYLSVSGTRDYLERQLGAHAEETATSLALAIASAPDPGDAVMLGTIVGPVFDRGQFERIEIISIAGKVLVKRTLEPAELTVPGWFQRVFPIEAPGGQALISAGWKQVGRVMVQSRPAIAYSHLWQSTIDTLLWLFLLYLAALAALRAMLAVLLRALSAIESAANDIGERKFRTIDIKPWARELKSVVEAFNLLSRKIRLAIDTEVGRAEQFRQEAFKDPLTKLNNRQGLQTQMQQVFERGAADKSGAFALLEIHGLADYNGKFGFQKTDQLLLQVAEIISASGEEPDFICGRLNGATFVVLLSGSDAQVISAGLSSLFHQLQAALEQTGARGVAALRLGAVQFDGLDQIFSRLLSAADLALTRTGTGGGCEIVPLEDSDVEIRGAGEWRRLIVQALEERHLSLFIQTAIVLPGKQTLHTEVNVRLKESTGVAVPARLFIPMVMRHKLGSQLDAVVLDLVMERMKQGGVAQNIAINVSGPSLGDAVFLDQLSARLSAAPDLAKRLVFETTEAAFLEQFVAVTAFAQCVRALGAQFALDNFMVSGASLRHLESSLPYYIKLSASLTGDLFSSAETRFLVSSLVRIAQSLEIPVIAQGIEQEESIDVLTRLGVVGAQGYSVGRPEPW